MACTGPCFYKYATIVGEIVVTLWKGPLRQIIIDLASEGRANKPIPHTSTINTRLGVNLAMA
jgi:hypothetical protein